MQVSSFNFLNEHYIIIALLLVIIYLFVYRSSNICSHCRKNIIEGFDTQAIAADQAAANLTPAQAANLAAGLANAQAASSKNFR